MEKIPSDVAPEIPELGEDKERYQPGPDEPSQAGDREESQEKRETFEPDPAVERE